MMKPMEIIKEAKPETAGEELYLVHLRRHEGEEPREEDFDHEEGPRKRGHSIGEELWEVHVKRSLGVKPDIDQEDDGSKKDDAPKVAPKGPNECRYNLRSRDSKKR